MFSYIYIYTHRGTSYLERLSLRVGVPEVVGGQGVGRPIGDVKLGAK